MITRKQIKLVEKLQELENKKRKLQQDYNNLIYKNNGYTNLGLFDYIGRHKVLNCEELFKKVLRIYIKNAIRKINKQIKELIWEETSGIEEIQEEN